MAMKMLIFEIKTKNKTKQKTLEDLTCCLQLGED